MELLLQAVVWIVIAIGGLRALPPTQCECESEKRVSKRTAAFVFVFYLAALWVLVDAAMSMVKALWGGFL